MNHIPFGVVLSTFHMMPGQSLRFYGLQSWDRTNYLHILKMLLYQMSYLQRTYQDVLSLSLHNLLGCKIQHTSCLSACGLINHASRIRLSLLRLHCQIAFPCEVRLNDYLLVYSIR